MSFEEIYNDHAARVYRYLCFKLRDQQLAEDLLQETFLAVYRQRSRIGEVVSIRSWVLGIAHHKMVDYLRRGTVPTVEMTNDIPSLELGGSLELWEMLKQLDDSSRTIIYGLYVEGLSYRELAHMLSVPEGTVKSRAYTARVKLRRWMEGNHERTQ